MTGTLFEKITFTLKTLFHFRFITCLELAKVMGDLGERLSDEEVEQRIGKNLRITALTLCLTDTGDDEMGRQGSVDILQDFHPLLSQLNRKGNVGIPFRFISAEFPS